MLAQYRNIEECALSVDYASTNWDGEAGAEKPPILLKISHSLVLRNQLNGLGARLFLLPILDELHVRLENVLAFFDQNGCGLYKFVIAPVDMCDE